MAESAEARSLRLVYYCSGHGYGHATRVSAFASHLLRLPQRPIIHIVSSAPKHVFADSIALGALYRNANIDPVIVQPLAYRVDREKSRQVLKDFLDQKPAKLAEETHWLHEVRADCVLSDAAFLGCAAANAAGIPSVLITNFSFDSVFSYLSTPFIDSTESFDSLQPVPSTKPLLPPDVPIPIEELQPLVEELRQGYRCADLLLRLPGNIPMPSFPMIPDLPSQDWVDRRTMTFIPEVTNHLLDTPSSYVLWPQVPFPLEYPAKRLPRSVVNAPLLVRSPDPSVYTPEGRSRLLSSLGVPVDRHDPATTKILIVSFGGQVFHKPHSHSRSPSASGTPRPAVLTPSVLINGVTPPKDVLSRKAKSLSTRKDTGSVADDLSDALRNSLVTSFNHGSPRVVQDRSHGTSKLIIPGAPPASIPNSPMAASNPIFNTIPPTPKADSTTIFPDIEEAVGEEDIGRLLPDDSWIAIVCGVSKDWAKEDGEELPDSFYVAPKYVYMPDLTAAADVLLGKLGYGTVSECVDACTPFVYVSRPLFIEEHGLRLLLDKDGVGVELSRDSYEAGNWADAMESAYEKGKAAKALKRQEGETGKRAAEGKEMATYLVDWVERWKDLDLHD